MSAELPLLVRSFAVGERTATLTIRRPVKGKVTSVCCEWSPSAPSSLSAQEWREYRAGRDAAVADMAAELGVNVAVIDA